MKLRRRIQKSVGLTLVEVMIVMGISALFFLFLYTIIRNVGTGMTRIQRVVPLQRDLQLAQQVIRKDLLSAPRHSLGNEVPDPGFEGGPSRITTTNPPPTGSWYCEPRRTRKDDQNPRRTFRGYVNASTWSVRNGNYGLTLNTEGWNSVSPYNRSSNFTLSNGTYLFGGWGRHFGDSGASVSLRPLIGASSYINPNGGTWNFTAQKVINNLSNDFRIEISILTFSKDDHSIDLFDDLIVTPTTADLDTVNGVAYKFDRFQVDGPLAGQRIHCRYRLVPNQASGRLIREQWNDVSSRWDPLYSLENIRRLLISWDFGQGTPGTLPSAADWNATFANGMNFPVSVTVEAGDVGATGNNTLSLTFSVFSVVP
jgi:type II secretory pathway pseudopilin PulG